MPDRPPNDELDPELLARFLAHECSEGESVAVRRFLMAHPEVAERIERFLHRLDAPVDPAPPSPPAAAAWATLRGRMHEAAPTAPRVGAAPPPPYHPRSTPPRVTPARGHAAARHPAHPRHWWRHALTILTASAATLAGVMYGATHRAPATEAESSRRTFATGAREHAEIRLSDGTRIRIAPGSRLRIGGEFGIERRDVYLEGEAFFEVVHDPKRPFTVFAGSASANDIGTAFSVRSYPDDHAVQVMVREGKVALSGVGPLAAGDVGRLTSDGRASVAHGADVAALLGWVDGRLVFRDAPLGAVLRDMHRWYGVDFRLADSTLDALPFTGTLAEDRTDDAVGILAATLGLRARRSHGIVVLEAIPGTTPRPSTHRTGGHRRTPSRLSRTSAAAS